MASNASARAGAVLLMVAVSVVGCGGSAFTSTGAGVDGGGEPQDGSTSGMNDGGVSVDGGVPQEAAAGEAGPGEPAIACGPGASAPSCTKTCCVDKANGSFDYKCEDALTCSAAQGTGLRCNNSADCKPNEVCCIAQVQNAFYARCATSCAAGDGQLCTMPLDTKCPATEPCSNNNIGSWNLPGSYATCGGVSP